MKRNTKTWLGFERFVDFLFDLPGSFDASELLNRTEEQNHPSFSEPQKKNVTVRLK